MRRGNHPCCSIPQGFYPRGCWSCNSTRMGSLVAPQVPSPRGQGDRTLCTDSPAASQHGLISPAQASLPARASPGCGRGAFLALSQTEGGGLQILLALSERSDCKILHCLLPSSFPRLPRGPCVQRAAPAPAPSHRLLTGRGLESAWRVPAAEFRLEIELGNWFCPHPIPLDFFVIL